MILNRQRGVAVSLASLDRFWQRALRSLRLPEDSLTVCLVSERQIARWNRAYRGKHGPTDVLSFPADGNRRGPAGSGAKRGNGRRSAAKAKGNMPPGAGIEPGQYLGDIAISPAVARRNSRRLGRGLGQELQILMLHGALHLLGYDHENDHGEMNRIERRLRRQLGLARS